MTYRGYRQDPDDFAMDLAEMRRERTARRRALRRGDEPSPYDEDDPTPEEDQEGCAKSQSQ